MAKTLLLYLLALLPALLSAQDPRIEYFTVTDGLSAREINQLYIGEDDFVWVATMDGLNRFDGQKFRRIGEQATGQPGLSRSAVGSVGTDNEGKMVVIFQDFYGYFDRYDPRTGSVEQVRLAPSTGVRGHPRAIVVDELGRTFVVSIGTEGTFLYEFTPNAADGSRLFTPIYHEPTDAWTTLTPRVEILPLSSGQFLLYDEEHGFRHLSATGNLLSEPFAGQVRLDRFYTFAEAANGRVFLTFRDGIEVFSWSPETRDYVPVLSQDSELRFPFIYKDKLGQLLFLGTEDILGEQAPVDYYLVDTSGRFMAFETNLPIRRSLSALAAVDWRETAYLGLREGLGVVEGYRNEVTTFLTSRAAEPAHPVTGLAEDVRGNVYAQERETYVYRLRPGAASLDTLVLIDAQDTTRRVDFRGGAGLAYDERRDVLWIAGRQPAPGKSGLLVRHELTTGRTVVYYLDYRPTCLTVGPDGGVYLGGADTRRTGLLLRFNPRSGETLVLRDNATPANEIAGFQINQLSFQADRSLFLATENRGLLQYSPGTGRLREPFAETTQAGAAAGAGKVGEAVYATHTDAAGAVWVGSDAGLHQLDTLSGTFLTFGRAEGLSSNLVYGILPDTLGGLWLSTANGLTYLPADRQPGSVRRYYRQDGLSNDVFLPNSYLRGQDGKYYFGSPTGLTTFREADLAGSSAGADVMLTEIDIFGRNEDRTLTQNLDKLNRVTVRAREKSIAISFALPAGQLPSSGHFRYKLEGFNDDWVPLVSERTIRFNNLGAGTYVLRIQAAGANGNYGKRERRLSIRVKQYVVERMWFQILVVAAFAGLLFYIFQAKLREKLQNEQLRTQLSADIHDEVSGLLAGITLQAELLKNKTEDKKLQDRLHTVGEAGRSAMSKMSDVIWSIDSRRDTIGNLLQRMQEHADEVLLPLDIRYDFRASGFDNTDKELPGNIRQDVYFIYKEAINNVARHSNATEVQIEVEQFAQFFELFVRDNGRPTNPTASSNSPRTSVRAQKTGQGKDNMRMRARRLKGDLSIDDREGYTLTFRMKRLG